MLLSRAELAGCEADRRRLERRRCKVPFVVERNCDVHQLLRDKMHGSQRGRGRWSASSSPLARLDLSVRRLVAALLASGEDIVEVLAELIE